MADQSKEEKKPTCFIAMPITTPEKAAAEDCGGDVDHFVHVLHELFIPAIEAAGFKAIPPISQGSEIIHRDIIDQLVQADLVLVDMSTLNANVFFEFGIRTSLNKPVCLVCDDKTPKIPFDAGTANRLPYNSSLHSWVVKAEKPKITQHATASYDRSKGKNSLWQHFGVPAVGEAPKEPGSSDEKLEFIMRQLETISRQTERATVREANTMRDDETTDRRILDYLDNHGFRVKGVVPVIDTTGYRHRILLDTDVSDEHIEATNGLLRMAFPGTRLDVKRAWK